MSRLLWSNDRAIWRVVVGVELVPALAWQRVEGMREAVPRLDHHLHDDQRNV